MDSEIPALEVITAIEEPELENYVAELLFSQGWTIIYRALDGYELENLLHSRAGMRTVLLYTSGLPGFASDLLVQQESLGFMAISLDACEGKLNPHLIMSAIRSKIRHPHFSPTTPQKIAPLLHKAVERKRVIAVTGSSGSPGRTLFSMALAEELAQSWPITVVDGDFRNRTLTRNSRNGGDESFEVAALDPSERPTQLPEVGERDLTIVDVGLLPPLHDLINDRRWQAGLINDILEKTTHLLYICKSTRGSIDEVHEFIREFPALLKSTPITFICIAQGSSRSDREALSRFDALLAGGRKAIIQQRLLVDTFSIPLLTTPTRSKKEIARIALSLV